MAKEKDPIADQTLPTKESAENVSKLLGCSGAHKKGDFWGPCESEKDLMKTLGSGSADLEGLSKAVGSCIESMFPEREEKAKK